MKHLTLTLFLILGLSTSASAIERVWTLIYIYVDARDLDKGNHELIDKWTISSEIGLTQTFKNLTSCRKELQKLVLEKSSEEDMRLVVNDTFDDFKPTALLGWRDQLFFHIECSPNRIVKD